MRLFVKDSERRPDPEPLRTDDRKVIVVGLAAWVATTIVLLVLLGTLVESGRLGWLWTALVGVGLGVVLLVYVHRRRV
jgi:hypothetical protein